MRTVQCYGDNGWYDESWITDYTSTVSPRVKEIVLWYVNMDSSAKLERLNNWSTLYCEIKIYLTNDFIKSILTLSDQQRSFVICTISCRTELIPSSDIDILQLLTLRILVLYLCRFVHVWCGWHHFSLWLKVSW